MSMMVMMMLALLKLVTWASSLSSGSRWRRAYPLLEQQIMSMFNLLVGLHIPGLSLARIFHVPSGQFSACSLVDGSRQTDLFWRLHGKKWISSCRSHQYLFALQNPISHKICFRFQPGFIERQVKQELTGKLGRTRETGEKKKRPD